MASTKNLALYLLGMLAMASIASATWPPPPEPEPEPMPEPEPEPEPCNCDGNAGCPCSAKRRIRNDGTNNAVIVQADVAASSNRVNNARKSPSMSVAENKFTTKKVFLKQRNQSNGRIGGSGN